MGEGLGREPDNSRLGTAHAHIYADTFPNVLLGIQR